MKKICCVIIAAMLFLLTTTNVFAATVPEFTIKDGNTHLGIFKTSAMTEQNKNVMREWLSSERNLLIRTGTGQIWFIVVPSGASINVWKGTNGLATILFTKANSYGIAWGRSSASSGFDTHTALVCAKAQEISSCTIITGTLLATGEIALPTPTASYIADITGNLLLEDDGGLFSAPDEEGGGILDWLKGFWQSLLDFVKSIFIPEDGYFEKWYNEIKSKAEDKFSALFALYDILEGLFKSEQGGDYVGNLILDIPANHFWNGSPAIKADLLKSVLPFAVGVRDMFTVIIVIFTAIVCYRRLVVMFEK